MHQTRLNSEQFKKIKKPSKYHAVRTELDGIKFDSKAELEMYRLLKSDPKNHHIDVHPKVTLPGGIKLSVDFLVWKKDGSAEAVEVKGFSTQDFKTKRKLFDQFHPLAPLKVLKLNRSRWEAM